MSPNLMQFYSDIIVRACRFIVVLAWFLDVSNLDVYPRSESTELAEAVSIASLSYFDGTLLVNSMYMII